MDLMNYSTTEESVDMELLNPSTDEPILDDKGKPITISVLGTDSKEFKKIERRIKDDLFREQRTGRGKIKLNASKVEEELQMKLEILITGWSNNLEIDGKKLEFNRKNLKLLITHPNLVWVKEQIMDFVSDRANFMKTSVKD